MSEDTEKIAIIAGAGPAGLTAAYELKKRTDIQPIIFEKTESMGGIAQTVLYKGNRIDLVGVTGSTQKAKGLAIGGSLCYLFKLKKNFILSPKSRQQSMMLTEK